MNATSSKQASQDLDHLIETVIADIEPTIICKENGQKAVLMGLDEFNAWQETCYLLSSPANAEHIFQSIRDIEMGKTFEKPLFE